jgi:hypothetical protein
MAPLLLELSSLEVETLDVEVNIAERESEAEYLTIRQEQGSAVSILTTPAVRNAVVLPGRCCCCCCPCCCLP